MYTCVYLFSFLLFFAIFLLVFLSLSLCLSLQFFSIFCFGVHWFFFRFYRALEFRHEIRVRHMLDNVCLFHVRALTSKIQNTFFHKETRETCWPLYCLYFNLFSSRCLCSVSGLKMKWGRISVSQKKPDG